ncbi:hypothetical protein HYX12_01990 [Candidatus Woesearchaeota archaeon]|nr:hypothetical protein [Candidatus Woesearchaeota archaeon]
MMEYMYSIYQEPGWMIIGVTLVGLWSLIWKGIGLWYTGKYQQKGWFIAILFLNTLGLLPMIYLLWFNPELEKKSQAKAVKYAKKKKK